jgi:hypothetical protein
MDEYGRQKKQETAAGLVDPKDYVLRNGLNWYVYCENNPLKFVDKTGLLPIALPWIDIIPLPTWICPGYIFPSPAVDALEDYNTHNSKEDEKAKEAARQQGKLKILDKMNKEPPRHPNFKPPKNWDGKKKKGPDGKYYWTDKKGRRWVPHVDKKHDPHWDVQKPKGGYKHYDDVYPEDGAYNDVYNYDGPTNYGDDNSDSNSTPPGYIKGPGGVLIPST